MPSFRKGKWWTNKSRFEQILICILLLALILIIILLAFLFIPRHTEQPKICDSRICLQEAAKIIERIDPTIDPCDNFYDFACGNFLKKSHGDPKLNLPNKVKEKIKHQLIELYSENIKDEDHKMVKAAKGLFRKCMNQSEIERDNLRTIKDALRAVGGWPILEGIQWNEEQFDWINATYKLRELGYPYDVFFDVNVEVDPQNWDKYILLVRPFHSFPGEVTDHFSESMELERMTEVAVTFGSPYSRDRIKQEMNTTYQFWKNMKMFPFGADNTRQSIGEFEMYGEHFNWFQFISKMVGPKIQISKHDLALFQSASNYNEYFKLIARTPKRVLANYMMWHVIEKQTSYLTKSLRNLKPKERECTRAEFCLGIMQKSFSPNPIEILRERKYLSFKQMDYQKQLMENMKIEFVTKIEKLSWMDREEKDATTRKAKDIKIRIGVYEDYMDDKILNELDVDMVKPRSQTFLGLLAQATRNYQTGRYKLLIQPKIEDSIHADSTIPYYEENSNSIIVPTTAIEGLFFADDLRPKYLNYAKSAGFAFTEFFGVVGKWGFSNETTRNIMDIMECFLNQTKHDKVHDYRNEVQLIVYQTLGEQISHAAYKKWEGQHGEELKLIGLDYTPWQLYWIASTNCYVSDSKNMFNNPQTSRMANQRSRMNNPDFAKDFKCESSSKMNLANRCRIL